MQDTEDNGDDGSVWLSILFGAVLFACIIGSTLFIILKPLAAKVSFLGITAGALEQKVSIIFLRSIYRGVECRKLFETGGGR